jgi:acyl-coenzyme A thioesterase PaaI-like protein
VTTARPGPPSIEQLQRLLDHDSPFARSYSFHVKEAAEGSCTIAVPFLPHFERPGGILSGQVFQTAADVAMWLAIKTIRGIDDPSVTTQMETTFLQPARASFICRAVVLDTAARRVFGIAECRSQNGSLLAHHSMTYIRPA